MGRLPWPVALLLVSLAHRGGRAEDRGLIGHWKLSGDANDASGLGNHGQVVGVDLTAPGPDGRPGGAARFDGKGAFTRIPASPALSLGKGDFSLAVWAHTEEALDDIPGDLASKYDPVARRGFNWGIKDGAGVTNSQANSRNIHFGIDAGTEPAWADVGRLGRAVFVMALAVHDGRLFAGTCESGAGEAGHVYVHDGSTRWEDCGAPDRCNAVTSLASHGGRLYAGTGRYRLAGSALPESSNANLGGAVFRYDGGAWTECGRLPWVEAVGGMAVYRGDLYASSLYKPAGFFRYKGGCEWASCPLPADGRRIVALGVYNGHLYGSSYDGCTVARFDGEGWEAVGALEPSGQTYSFAVASGALFIGTWPNGKVFRSGDGRTWIPAGRLGEEKEVMPMVVHNGKLYAGTLPLAEVYRYDGGEAWTCTGRLDLTPGVRYRRAWSMAVYRGRLYCGTLPSGRVHALDVGRSVTHDHALKAGWRHLAAVREGGRLGLYVDGRLVASSPATDASPLDLTNDEPLKIGLGAQDSFRGSLSDLRLYGRALSAGEVAEIAAGVTPRDRP